MIKKVYITELFNKIRILVNNLKIQTYIVGNSLL